MLIERIQQAEKAYKDAMDQVKDADLMDAFRPVFEENPGLESFSWNQYTPYFNDGDTCRFCWKRCSGITSVSR